MEARLTWQRMLKLKKEETYSKQEVDVLVSNPIDAYTKTESDQKYATKSELETKQSALS